MIIIEIKSSDKCFDDIAAFITFKYDERIKDIVKNQPERYWHPDTKCWEVPIRYLDSLCKELSQYEIDIIDSSNLLQYSNNESKSKILIPDNYKFKNAPYKHQIEGIEFGLNSDNFILEDEQGLGKTMQVIHIACIRKQLYNYKHCLIICGVNGLKWNWRNEVRKHCDEDAYILGTRFKKNKEYIGSVNDRLEDLDKLNQLPYFIITNIETLRNDDIMKKLKELCDNDIINMIAIDEIHKCKNPTSQQGKAILKLQAKNMIAMTGTPLMNSPLDLYVPLKWLGYENHNFYQFKNHYCIMGGFGDYQVVGYKNIEQLKNQLAFCSLRRLKKDVLDLPEKIYSIEYVEMSPKQSKIYREVKMEVMENIDKIKASANPLSEMIRLRQATGCTSILSSKINESAKLDRLDELLEEIVANGNKVIIFSNWTSMTDIMYRRYQKYNPAIITGDVKDRNYEEKLFMENEYCKIIIGTTGAMGTGLTLTAANTVIFVDEPWNRALKEQAEDRAHRIGTKDNVNIITLITKDTIDERINELVEKKGVIADLLVDGKDIPSNREDLVDFLLS